MPSVSVHDQTGAAVLFLCQFFLQQNTNLDSFNETRPLVIPAELAYWVDDPIHLPQLHAVHQAIELIEIHLYLLVIVWIAFVVAFIEHSQNRLPIPIIGWMCINIDFQFLKIWIHILQPSKTCGMLA